jgi:RNA methyltransferase, TrmH family
MLSKAQIKHIRSLSQQKYRKEHNEFIAEGDKISREWLKTNNRIRYIIATNNWADENEGDIASHSEAVVEVVPESLLGSVSNLQTPNQVVLVVGMPEAPKHLPESGWVLALDNIQDPGNMGTIIRIADWFGVKDIVCSEDCVDVYNPKVVQSAMGGHLRIRFHETDLTGYLKNIRYPVIAATLNGENLYSVPSQEQAVLLIGNESKGLESSLVSLASMKITIPGKGGAESLNAAVSAGVICSHLMPH